MPILPAEPGIYPEDLWHESGEGGDPERRWWCLHTRPRQEKAAARHLHSLRIAHYLPLVVHEGQTPGGRKIRSVVPLFSGYLFLWGDDHDRVEAIRGNHLANVLDVGDQAAIRRDLEQIHRLVCSGLHVRHEPVFPVGAKIRIVSGPLEGLIGTVLRRQGHQERFAASVRFLNQSATVELQNWQVERIDDLALSGSRRPTDSEDDTPAARPA